MTQTVAPVRTAPLSRVHVNPRWATFGILSFAALWTFALPILPVVLAIGLMLFWQESWQQTAHPLLRALSFQAVALAGGVTMLALSPSCAGGAMLGLLLMNLAATVLSGRRSR